AKNILIIERMKKHGIARERIVDGLIKGGTLPPALIEKILDAKDMQAVLALVRSKFRGIELKEGKAGMADLEIALEKSIAAQKVTAFHRSALSVGVIIGFLLLKEEEMNNLRKIAKGKAFELPESEIRDMIVTV
ncbi:MAG: V-type ATPase subunit, partial [Candidatus Micrarchaeota archaeon]